MRLQDGDLVLYQHEATFELDYPHVTITMMKVKKAIMDGTQFIDEEDNLRYNYRVRSISKDEKLIDNCCYDFLRTVEEDEKMKKQEKNGNKNVKFALCLLDEDENIVNKRDITTRWTEDIEEDLREKFNVDVNKEIACVVATEIRKNTTEEFIYKLLNGES